MFQVLILAMEGHKKPLWTFYFAEVTDIEEMHPHKVIL
jgi:hypothetical protein